jgi:hypothetical protein
LQRAFHTEALTALQLAVVIVTSSSAFVVVEIERSRPRRRHATQAPNQKESVS